MELTDETLYALRDALHWAADQYAMVHIQAGPHTYMIPGDQLWRLVVLLTQ